MANIVREWKSASRFAKAGINRAAPIKRNADRLESIARSKAELEQAKNQKWNIGKGTKSQFRKQKKDDIADRRYWLNYNRTKSIYTSDTPSVFGTNGKPYKPLQGRIQKVSRTTPPPAATPEAGMSLREKVKNAARPITQVDPAVNNLMTGLRLNRGWDVGLGVGLAGAGVAGAMWNYQSPQYRVGSTYQSQVTGQGVYQGPPPQANYINEGISGSKYDMGATGDLTLALHKNRRG